MRVDKLVEIRERLKEGLISYHDAYEIIKSMPKPWHEAEWKLDRDLLIKDYCENCNSSSGPFVLQHTKHPDKFKKVKEQIALGYLKIEVGDIDAHFKLLMQTHIKSVVENRYELKPGCPKCKSLSIRSRQSLSPKYVCKCTFSFEEPEIVDYYPGYCCSGKEKVTEKIYKDDYFFIRKKMIYDYMEENDEVIGRVSLIESINQSLEYLSFVNTKTTCKKCAFMEDYHYTFE